MIARPGFLLDEHIPPALARALRETEPGIEVYAVGDGIAPPLGTKDPALLEWLEQRNCRLITNNRRSLPRHLAGHLAAGGHVPGILVLPENLSGWRDLIDNLVLIWQLAEQAEIRDQIRFLPL